MLRLLRAWRAKADNRPWLRLTQSRRAAIAISAVAAGAGLAVVAVMLLAGSPGARSSRMTAVLPAKSAEGRPVALEAGPGRRLPAGSLRVAGSAVRRHARPGAGPIQSINEGARAGGPATGPPVSGGVAEAELKSAVVRERSRQSGVSLTPSSTKPYWACPEGVCEAIVDPPAAKTDGHWTLPDGTQALEGSGKKGGYDPQDLQSAYNISVSGGAPQQHYEERQTIALVETGSYESAEADLAGYRSAYGLSPCTHADGCLRVVNEHGAEGKLPLPYASWALETSLDLDMASAACPHCHILLVEASKETLGDLAESANTAAKLGATEISNSYGVPESSEEAKTGRKRSPCGSGACSRLNADYNHPGIVVTASAGDAGYDNYLRGGSSPLYPAVSPNVIAVGGTSLHRAGAGGRKWSEAVWSEPETTGLGTGSGCSLESKPSWQTDGGCTGRTDNDVAAVGACETPVSVYVSADGGWVDACGTSASAPLVAGIEAHAGEIAGDAVPTADAFYQQRSSLYHVMTGRNGACSPVYLCSAEAQIEGYDGPAGNGTPAGGPVAVAGEPPSVRTEPMSGRETMNGTVDPNGLETTYCFEYGATTSYGSCAPAVETSAGAGMGAKTVGHALTGPPPEIFHYRLVATNADGKSYGEDQIVDTAPPTVSGVTPASGYTVGGTQVVITGSNFIGVTAVKFGSTPAKTFAVLSETEIEVEAPAGTGTVDVTAENTNGSSATGEADRFAYVLPPQPIVAGVTPNSGWNIGGTKLTITGTNFIGVTAVKFGSTPAKTFLVLSETEVEAEAPAGIGTVDVTVENAGGASVTSEADRFAYVLPPPPKVSGVTPSTGWNIGGGRIKVAGADFINVTAVRFGSAQAQSFNAVSDTEIEAVPPRGTGTVEVTVENAGGASVTSEADRFTYVPLQSPTVSELTPGVGWGKGATVATINGAGFAGVTAVHFGPTPAASFDVISETEIEVVSPAGTGTVAVTVTTPAGTSAASPADMFTYETGSSIGEPAWLSPAGLAEGIPNAAFPDPDIAVDGRGDAAAIWKTCKGQGKECEAERSFIEAAFRPAGGRWGAPVPLSATAGSSGEPQIAFDRRGDAVAVFELYSEPGTSEIPAQHGLIQAAFRRAGGSWQPPVTLSSECRDTQLSPHLAVDPAGDAVASWRCPVAGTHRILVQASFMPAGEAWQTPVALTETTQNNGEETLSSPAVVIDSHGDAFAGWSHGGFDGVTEVASRPADEGWQAATVVAAEGGEPKLGADDAGDAYALVDQEEGYGVAYRPAGGGWQAPTQVAPRVTGGLPNGPFQPELVVDGKGDAAAIWWEWNENVQHVQAAYKPAAGNWRQPTSVGSVCSGFSFCSPEPQVAFDKLGNAVAIWQQPTEGHFGNEASRLSAGGSWTKPVEIPGEGVGNDDEARLALAPQGNGAAVWESGINDEKWTIQTANLNFLPRPVVTKIEPDSGPTSGGTAVTITGEHLENVTAVSFGSSEAASFEVESETQIKAVSPAGSGTVDTTLTMKEGGVSTMSSADLFTYQEAPAVETGVAAPAQSTATLNATVDPKGLAVSACEFEYGSSPTYGASVPCSTPPGPGTTPVAVSATLSGLSRYASYYYRIVATNADGTSYGAARTFKTLPEPPTVVTGAAFPVWEATATMAATVNAREEALSDCHFQYGLSLALGKSTPCGSLPSSVETSEVVTAQAGTMHPNTTYYYRIVATNRGGTSYGSTQEFKTLAPELPEIGRCVKLEAETGEYTSASCTTVSPGQETGKYEWRPWPLASRRLTGKGGAATFETVGGVAVKCHESTLTGEYTGSQTASASIVFTGCEASRDLTGQCQGEGANAGEIKTAPLETTLGFITAGAAPKSGLRMSPVSQPDIASFECGTRRITIAGSAIAPVGKVDKTSSSFTLKYKAKKGRQSPESFETGLRSVLVLLDETAEEQAGLSTIIVISSGEALEIKAIA